VADIEGLRLSRPGAARTSSQLTRRQAEVLRLAINGLYAKEIARELGISVRTVEGHIATMRKRSGARSLGELTAWGVVMGAHLSGDTSAVTPYAGSPEAALGAAAGEGRTLTRSCQKIPDLLDTVITSGPPESGSADARQLPRLGRGRPTVMTAEAIATARSLLATHTIKAIAWKLGVSRSTIYAHMEAIRSESPGVG
jgi:DNA-binding CsgD family transcriptional regulator